MFINSIDYRQPVEFGSRNLMHAIYFVSKFKVKAVSYVM